MSKILVIDPDNKADKIYLPLFEGSDNQVVFAATAAEGLTLNGRDSFDLVFLEANLPDGSGLEVLRQIKSENFRTIVFLVANQGSTQVAIQAIKEGAYDYLLKPFEPFRFVSLVEDALVSGRLLQNEVVWPEEQPQPETDDNIIGFSPVMQEVYKMIGRVAPSDVNVLLRGESGTGKELVAGAIYRYSSRAQKAFLAVNCAAIPENLLESELFGYEKGAFTGALVRKIGKFEQANGGTIFLDEVGDMSLATQAKVLRVLQEGCFERLGGEQTHRVDVRIVAATNKNLEKAIKAGLFREDLYYRLKVITITLPPLRLRGDDIVELAQYFLDKNCKALKKERLTFTQQALKCLKEYQWPGNIRELENVIKRAVVLSKGKVISEQILQEELGAGQEDISSQAVSGEFLSANWNQYDGELYEKVLGETEKKLIVEILQKTGGNQVKTAKILGISRMMLRDRIQRFGIKVETFVSNE